MEILNFVAGPFQTNCYIVRAEKRCSIIDPGVGAFEVVTKYVTDAGLEVEAVLLTHGHLDHSRDAGRLANHFNLPVHIHPADEYMLAGGDGVSEQAKIICEADKMVQPQEVRGLAHGQDLTIAGETFSLRHAPGHSPGSMLFVGNQLCFSGDVLFQGSIGRTDLPGSDPAVMQQSLAEQVLTLDDALGILPGHGGNTTMAAERATNPYLQF